MSSGRNLRSNGVNLTLTALVFCLLATALLIFARSDIAKADGFTTNIGLYNDGGGKKLTVSGAPGVNSKIRLKDWQAVPGLSMTYRFKIVDEAAPVVVISSDGLCWEPPPDESKHVATCQVSFTGSNATIFSSLRIKGYDGNDRITVENDTTCSIANNFPLSVKIYGGAGNDTIDGGCGKDQLLGETDSDVLIGAGDNRQDSLDCGPEEDFYLPDTQDLLTSCEKFGLVL